MAQHSPVIHLHQGDLPDNVHFTTSIAIDTEAMGLFQHRDRLCLVQLSQGDGICHLVQINPSTFKAPNLVRLLEDPTILKLFHFARFDVAILYKYLGAVTQPVYCTKIASKMTRTFTDRHSLKDLCAEFLGVEISKQSQTSDWGALQLTKEQMMYAATDVLYLHKLKEHLDKLLAREGRQALAQACFDFLPARAQLDLLGFDQPDIFEH